MVCTNFANKAQSDSDLTQKTTFKMSYCVLSCQFPLGIAMNTYINKVSEKQYSLVLGERVAPNSFNPGLEEMNRMTSLKCLLH